MEYNDPNQELFFELLSATQRLQKIKHEQEQFKDQLCEIRRWVNLASPERVQLYRVNFPEVFEWLDDV